uniref:Putative endonuclease/reverse transcriptase n=1 Tax=Ixodes ricinus TaxID=34613 RepID=A0A0K8RCH8_IXORI
MINMHQLAFTLISFFSSNCTNVHDLCWSEHINKIRHKAMKNLWFIRRNSNIAPSKVKVIAYKMYIRSTLEYAASVWDPYERIKLMNSKKFRGRRCNLFYTNTSDLILPQIG